MLSFSEKYMHRCLELASLGIGNTAPNPMVGSVIVYDDKIIGEGFHQQYGKPHAEVNAINSVKDKELLKRSTIYVNLEPCSHFGKTPPCADFIIENKIPNVVIGTPDVNEVVCQNGIKKLFDVGCNVKVGVLEKECRELNKRFFTFHEKKRPFILLKWAQTSDGFIDRIRTSSDKSPANISDKFHRILTHKWRSEEQAIMVGTQTALLDNPKLNTRQWTGNNPTRIVIDRTLRLPKNLNLFDGSIPTLIFTEIKNAESTTNKEFINIDFDENWLEQMLTILHKRKIQSIMVEGGSMLLNTFIQKNLWDEAGVFTSKIKFHNGIKAPTLIGNYIKREIIDGNIHEVIVPC
ncbi:MAG: riboflavin biosynthesis protein RibD [Bacteroidetes bacterium GWA2_31_9]|nr:MAG: riboflavin biosynthesis protein RibD [Bacteroidetes bacterium GWA2_31_9]